MAQVVETEEITETVTHTVKTIKSLKCDVCGKEFKGKYWNLTTQHSDWGFESVESVEAWWIQKFVKEFGEDNVMNIAKPTLKVSDFIQKWERLVEGSVDMFTYEDLIKAESEE